MKKKTLNNTACGICPKHIKNGLVFVVGIKTPQESIYIFLFNTS